MYELIRVRATVPNEIISVAILPGNTAYVDSADVSPDGQEIILSVGEVKFDVGSWKPAREISTMTKHRYGPAIKDAGPDIPILKQAKAEYAKLQ